jgi:NO-binding membrane sensor protein with MHYT domain
MLESQANRGILVGGCILAVGVAIMIWIGSMPNPLSSCSSGTSNCIAQGTSALQQVFVFFLGVLIAIVGGLIAVWGIVRRRSTRSRGISEFVGEGAEDEAARSYVDPGLSFMYRRPPPSKP